MTSLPGTMQIQNLIPMPYFKTTAFAAPVLGTIGGVCMFVLGMLWLNRRARAAARNSEGYATAGYAPGHDLPAAMDDSRRIAVVWPGDGAHRLRARLQLHCSQSCGFPTGRRPISPSRGSAA